MIWSSLYVLYILDYMVGCLFTYRVCVPGVNMRVAVINFNAGI